MSRQRHFYELNHSHFITASTYRRTRLFDSDLFRRHFVAILAALREEFSFKIMGWALIPEHFHLLIHPSSQADPSRIIQSLKERTALSILKTLRQHTQRPWCLRTLDRLTLPPTVHHHGPYRVWQRRFYDMNVWSQRKVNEKLDYMHANPVQRRLVSSPDQWAWSSFRFYYLEDSSILPMDRVA
jgi:putative transposase